VPKGCWFSADIQRKVESIIMGRIINIILNLQAISA
jgi:hypothetical protein